MSNKINLQITIPHETKYLQLIGKLCDKIGKKVCMPQSARESVSNTLNAVLTEAIVNTIKHSQTTVPNKNIKICIVLTDKELRIKVYDRGLGFDLNSVPNFNFDTDLLKECGRGIHIIRKLMDFIEYQKSNGGNILEMRKKLV